MPRNTFSVGVLRGATPGLSRLAQQIGGGDTSYQQGYDNELGLQSKLGMQLAQMRNADASARYHDAQASELGSKQRAIERRPDVYEEQVAATAGADVPLVRAIREQLRTGSAPQVPMGPPAEDGTMGVGSQQFDPAQRSKITLALQSLAPILTNTGDLHATDLAKGRELDSNRSLRDQVLAGTLDPKKLGVAQYAEKGSAPYHFDSSGLVGDMYTGKADTSSPRGTAYTENIVSQKNAHDASAGASRASAANSYAHANKANFETQQLKEAPKGKFDPASGMIIDVRGATARPVMVDGQPMGGRANDKPLPPAVVKQITEVRDNAATIARLEKSFKPDYGGKGVLGFGADMQLSASGNMGVDKESVEWWKNYRKQAELIERHALFGAALTPNEQASWQSADIAPGMHPKVIERNLATRAALSKKVFENARQDAIDAGHNERRVGAIADRNMDVPGAGGKNVSVDY